MKNLIFSFVFMLMVLFLSSNNPAWASEAASSHYAPGAMASFIDVPSGIPYNVLSPFFGYFGSASASSQFPIAGLVTAGVDANIFAWTPSFQYDLPNEVLGGHYAFTLSLPVMEMEVDATVSGPGGTTVRRSDSDAGLGDIYFSPIVLFWKKGNFTYLTSVGIYAPTGPFQLGRLANLGKNYWTFAPYGAMFYNNPKNGLEATVFTGFNFNTENTATNYQSGQEFFMDFTVNKRFKNGFGVGGTGYIFQQITGDSGSGAVLGSFKGRTVGVGPEVSYMAPISNKVLAAVELKWLPEFEVENRLRGNWVWFKFGLVWPLPQMPAPPP
jgi:hypothetical protein